MIFIGILFPASPAVAIGAGPAGRKVTPSAAAYPFICCAVGPPPMVGSFAGTRAELGTPEVAAAALAGIPAPVAVMVTTCVCIGILLIDINALSRPPVCPRL